MVNHTIGGYEIVRVLHEGGTCTLYVARDSELERDVVIKVLNGSQTLDDEVEVRFLREARSAAVLEHPNICSIFALHNTADGLHYFVMPLYRGETLRDTLSRQALTIERALSVAQQVAYALGHAHGHGVIHRDLKPENVFITAEALVKLLDFGVAKLGNENITRDGSLMGTVAYMAPEQIEGAPASVQTDIWAWGTMLFEMLSGHVPYAYANGLDMMAAIRDDPVPALPAALLDDIASEHLQPVVDACLAKDPTERARSMREIVQLLEPFISGTSRLETPLTRLAVNTVPVWHKPFVGREAELIQLTDNVSDGAKLVTLSGQVGVGKTHIALAFLYDPAIHVLFPDGMLYLPITANEVDDDVFLPPTQGIDGHVFERFVRQLADSLERDLGCHFERPEPWDALQQARAVTRMQLNERVHTWQQVLTPAIADQQVLLFVDGVYKPRAGLALLLEQLTQFCPNLVILTTSRQRLGVPSERVIVVGALPLPEQPHELATNPAAQLFVRTSQQTLHSAEENALLRLCQLLGGWPAALELAAHWHKQRDTHALAKAAASFALGARQGLAGLTGLLDAMWAELNWQEASALARLASLGERISFATASYVAEVSFDLLVALLDKHMLERDDSSQPETYRMNRLIVRYAQHKLASAPTLQATLQQRLADYLARRLSGIAPEHLVMTSSLLPAPTEVPFTAYVPLNDVEWHNLPTAWQVWLERPPKRFASMMVMLGERARYVYQEVTAADLLEQAQQHFSYYQGQLGTRSNLSSRQQQQWQQLLQLRYVAALQATCQYLRLTDVSAARRCFDILAEDDLRDVVMEMWSSVTTAAPDPALAEVLRQDPLAKPGVSPEAGVRGADSLWDGLDEVSRRNLFDDVFEVDGDGSQKWQRLEWQRSLERTLIETTLRLAEGQRAAARHNYQMITERYGDVPWALMTAPMLAQLVALATHLAPQDSVRLAEHAAASYRQRGDAWGEQLMAIVAAFITWGQGDLQHAADALQAVLEHPRPSPVACLQGHLLLADVRFEQGQWQTASQYFDYAHSYALSSSARDHLTATALAGLAKVASAQGDTVVAYAYLQQAFEHAEHAPLRVLEAAASVYLHSKDIDEATLVVVHLANYPEHRFVRDVGLDIPLPDERLHQNIAALLEQVRYLADASSWDVLAGEASILSLDAVLEHCREQLSSSDYSF